MPQELPEDSRELADLQHGVLSRIQALQSGMSPARVSWRVNGGHWQRLHRGVYATFTGQPDREAILWAALRRAGPDAVLSHWTAAELSKLTNSQSWLVHVTVPRDQHVRPISGVMIHRSSRVSQARHPAVMPPRTRIEETALDLAGCSKDLEDALAWLARACATRLTTPDRIRVALGQRARVRWRQALAAGLDDIEDGAHSALELRYVRRVERAHGLPRAQRQVRTVHGRRTEYRDALYAEFGGGGGNGRRGRPPTGGALAGPAPGQRGSHRRDHHLALHLGRCDPAPVPYRGPGGRGAPTPWLAGYPTPLRPLLPHRHGTPDLARCIVCAQLYRMHRADVIAGIGRQRNGGSRVH
jgi:hypothetical protein